MLPVKYFKITNLEENHNNYQFHDGLNILDDRLAKYISRVPFLHEGNEFNNDDFDMIREEASDLYIITLRYVPLFYEKGVWLREIELEPGSSEPVVEHQIKFWHPRIVLGRRWSLTDPATWAHFDLPNPTLYTLLEAIVESTDAAFRAEAIPNIVNEDWSKCVFIVPADPEIVPVEPALAQLNTDGDFFRFTDLIGLIVLYNDLELLEALHQAENIGESSHPYRKFLDCIAIMENSNAYKRLSVRAATFNNSAIVKWSYDNGYLLTNYTWLQAVRSGNLELLEWLEQQQTPHHPQSIIAAVEINRLDIVQFLHKQGCELRGNLCERAAANGNMEAVCWLWEQGQELNDAVYKAAATSRNSKLLKWLRYNMV